MEKKRNIIEWAMHYRQIVVFITALLVAFGVFALNRMNKNEFPDFTVRQGVVVAVYPGANVSEMEQQVTKPLENYIFTYKEVKKAKTKSFTRDGVAIIQIELNDDINGADKENFWSRFKLGVQQFKASLPSGVLALQVQDDFGDASSLLITMESNEKTYRELNDYMDDLKERLRDIESVGRLNVYGGQREQISVYVDTRKLAQYGIGPSVVSTALMAKGFNTTAGAQQTPRYEAPIHVDRSLNKVNDVEQMIVYSAPDGQVVRVKDIADVRREYPRTDEPRHEQRQEMYRAERGDEERTQHHRHGRSREEADRRLPTDAAQGRHDVHHHRPESGRPRLGGQLPQGASHRHHRCGRRGTAAHAHAWHWWLPVPSPSPSSSHWDFSTPSASN